MVWLRREDHEDRELHWLNPWATPSQRSGGRRLSEPEDALRTGSTLEVFNLLEASEPHLGTEDEVLVALELYERMGALADGESYLEELTMYSLQSAGPEVAGPLWAALLQHFEQRDCSRYEDIRVWGEPRGLAPYLGEAGLGPCSQD